MMVYIVWVKGIRVTLKIIQAESFTDHLRLGQVAKRLVKYSLAKDYSASNICFSRDFSQIVHSQVNWEQIARSTVLSNFHQLNTKLITNKSHKIQGNKLMQLQHFLL